MLKQSHQYTSIPFLHQLRRVFSHTNGPKGAECHRVIDCPKYLAPVVAVWPFERGRIVGLREAGWKYRRVAAHVEHNVSVVYRCFQQWSVEHFHIHRLGSGRPRSTDTRQYRHTLRAPVASSREEIRAHVAPHVSPRTIGNRRLAAGLITCVLPGCHLHHDTANNTAALVL